MSFEYVRACQSSRLGLTRQLQGAGMEVFKPPAFEPDNFEDATLHGIKQSGFRVVILVAFDVDMQAVASSAQRAQINGIGYAWVNANELPAPHDTQGWLYLRSLLPSRGMQAFAEQVSDYTSSGFNVTLSATSVDLTYSTSLHDAIMLYAHAATYVLSKGGNLQDGEAITAAVRNISFMGVGGSAVVLDRQGDRIESYEVMNYVQGADGGMNSVQVGVYSHADQQYRSYDRAVVWPGNTTQVPVDYISGGPVMCVASQALRVLLVPFQGGPQWQALRSPICFL